jgi:hypothetical protein
MRSFRHLRSEVITPAVLCPEIPAGIENAPKLLIFQRDAVSLPSIAELPHAKVARFFWRFLAWRELPRFRQTCPDFENPVEIFREVSRFPETSTDWRTVQEFGKRWG